MNLENIRERQRSVSPYLQALVIYLISRIVVAVAIFFAANFVAPNPMPGKWNATDPWTRFLLRYDSGWYLAIVKEGYSYDSSSLAGQNVAFFPLYPLLSGFLSSALRLSPENAALLASNLAILVGIPFFYKLVRDEYGHEVALYGTALLSFFPTAMFFSVGYSESLAFLLIVLFFYALKNERFLLAAVFAGLAMATRLTSVTLLLPLAWELWRRYAGDVRRLFAVGIPSVVLATSGLWLYMLYLGEKFGHPLAFTSALGAWQEGSTIRNNLPNSLMLRPFRQLSAIFTEGPLPNNVDPWIFLLFIALLIFFWRRLRPSHALFAAGALLMPYLTRSGGPLQFQGFLRYMMLAFPVLIIVGQLMVNRPWLALSVLGISASMLFMYMAMFSQWYWVG